LSKRRKWKHLQPCRKLLCRNLFLLNRNRLASKSKPNQKSRKECRSSRPSRSRHHSPFIRLRSSPSRRHRRLRCLLSPRRQPQKSPHRPRRRLHQQHRRRLRHGRNRRSFKRRRVEGESFRLQRALVRLCRRECPNRLRRMKSERRCNRSCRSGCAKNTGFRLRRLLDSGVPLTDPDNGLQRLDRVSRAIRPRLDSRVAARRPAHPQARVRGRARGLRHRRRNRPSNAVHRFMNASIVRSATSARRKRNWNRPIPGLSPNLKRRENSGRSH
jgi:hypothetical protein